MDHCGKMLQGLPSLRNETDKYLGKVARKVWLPAVPSFGKLDISISFPRWTEKGHKLSKTRVANGTKIQDLFFCSNIMAK